MERKKDAALWWFHTGKRTYLVIDIVHGRRGIRSWTMASNIIIEAGKGSRELSWMAGCLAFKNIYLKFLIQWF